MRLLCPEGVGSINVAGTEYTATDGVVVINDPTHAAAAQANGFTDADQPTTDATGAEFHGE